LERTGLSHPPHCPQFARQSVICGKRIRSDDQTIEEVKYNIKIGTRRAIDSGRGFIVKNTNNVCTVDVIFTVS
jgi:hypothetical protein